MTWSKINQNYSYIGFIKNKVLNVLMTKSFDVGLKKIADSFEKMAIELFKCSKN